MLVMVRHWNTVYVTQVAMSPMSVSYTYLSYHRYCDLFGLDPILQKTMNCLYKCRCLEVENWPHEFC